MKKIGKLILIIISISVLGFFSGCGVYDDIDLEKVKKDISLLKTTTLDLSKVKEVLGKSESYFGDLEDIEADSLDSFHINKEYIAKKNDKLLFSFKQAKKTDVNMVPLTSYIIVKPAEDKKELLEEQIDAYYENLLEEYETKEDATEEIKKHLQDVVKKEYEGYLIYILSNNNEAVWKLIEENSHPLLFENTKELSLEEFSKQFKIEEDDMIEYQAYISDKETSASLYIIVRPKKGKVETVKKQLNQYMNELEKKWSTYLPEEYQLVKDRMDTEIGSYLVYIVSKENKIVLNTIKDAIAKKEK